jgi:hypothetical protein
MSWHLANAEASQMPFSNAQKLQSLGVATPLAIELSNQITANTGNSRRLQELGYHPKLANYVATSITTGPMDAVQATRLGMDTITAKAITAMVNA